MLQRERSGPMEMTASAVEMVVLAMVMECSSMTVTMATISPLRQGIPPAATQTTGELFLSLSSPPRGGGEEDF